MSNKNNTPIQKATWRQNQRLASRFVKFILPEDYADYLAGAPRDEKESYARLEAATTDRRLRKERAEAKAKLPSKHSIFQIVKIGRRIPRLIARATKKLMSKGLSPNEVTFWKAHASRAGEALDLLRRECTIRHIPVPA